MGPTSSSNVELRLSVQDRHTLLDLAYASIESGLHGNALRVDPAEHSASLQQAGASFVTIKVADELRGCIGSVEPRRVLVIDVVKNAHAAAFSDPRFPALTVEEFERLRAHISVLSSCEPIAFNCEEDLLRQLRPGVDGVILEEGACRATYLPSVWKTLPDPREFLTQLKLKAGLQRDYWP
jgi:AmmeMemoRadiSam system protein A